MDPPGFRVNAADDDFATPSTGGPATGQGASTKVDLNIVRKKAVTQHPLPSLGSTSHSSPAVGLGSIPNQESIHYIVDDVLWYCVVECVVVFLVFC